jgi:hypothetical protein
MRLQIHSGKANQAMLMSERLMPKVEVITDPARVAKLVMIARAYTACEITAQQAKALAAKV